MNGWIEIRESGIHNKGVFAGKTIPKGTYIIEYTGEIITSEEADKRDTENEKKGLTYIFILDEDRCIDGAIHGNDAKYINHSCSPNCDCEIEGGKVWIVANKDIEKGEELVYDYEFPHDDDVKDACLCRSHNCRGFIQANAPNA
jgi:SET domain-containing protein